MPKKTPGTSPPLGSSQRLPQAWTLTAADTEMLLPPQAESWRGAKALWLCTVPVHLALGRGRAAAGRPETSSHGEEGVGPT